VALLLVNFVINKYRGVESLENRRDATHAKMISKPQPDPGVLCGSAAEVFRYFSSP
jgi:hypothetical protein